MRAPIRAAIAETTGKPAISLAIDYCGCAPGDKCLGPKKLRPGLCCKLVLFQPRPKKHVNEVYEGLINDLNERIKALVTTATTINDVTARLRVVTSERDCAQMELATLKEK